MCTLIGKALQAGPNTRFALVGSKLNLIENKWREIRQARSGASATFLSMKVCRRSAASCARLLARSGAAAAPARPPAAPALPAPLSAAFGRTAILPNPASLAGDDASAARYAPQRTRAWELDSFQDEALKSF